MLSGQKAPLSLKASAMETGKFMGWRLMGTIKPISPMTWEKTHIRACPPNGQKVLFESRRDKNTELYLMDADGGVVKNLTNNAEKDFFGRWNPVYFLHAVEPQYKHFTTLGAVKRTSLMQNFPNPFNPETWIPYYLAEAATVTVRIYDVKGELIRSIGVGKQAAGAYMSRQRAAYWDGKDNTGHSVASGVYFYQLMADDFSETRRMVIVK